MFGNKDDDIIKKISEINWFHSIDFGNGITTHGADDSQAKLKLIGMPENLSGLTVLDIGAWDGYFSFEAERRGAKRVLATDFHVWNGAEAYQGHVSKEGFDLAKKILRSKVKEKKMDVFEISPDKIGQFDLVLFLGVLYHLKHPLLALEKVASVTKKQLILETHTDMRDCQLPVAVFYPDKELGNDPTNWWGPNPAAVIAMLKTVGFRTVQIFSDEETSCRTVFHAWK